MLLAAPALPLSAPELVNPARGQYRWLGFGPGMGQPSGWPTMDTYIRYDWKDVEPSQGVYDFSRVRSDMDRATADGGLFAFRIMPLNMSIQDGTGTSLPGYIDRHERTWRWTDTEGKAWSIPDWNSSAYITAWAGLSRALAAEFDGDPRLAYVDISGIGHYGEGHDHPYGGAYPGPAGQVPTTATSGMAIAKAQVEAFKSTFLLWNLTTFLYDASGKFAQAASDGLLVDVVASSPRVGLRFDCIGGGASQNGAWLALDRAQTIAVSRGLPVSQQPGERWRIAPFVSEWCANIVPLSEVPPGAVDRGTIAQGLQQVRNRHISAVSSHNYKYSWSGDMATRYSAQEVAQFAEASKAAGYRLSATVSVDSVGGLSVVWSNAGSAPTYRGWAVNYTLTRDDGQTSVVSSSIDLRRVLPGNPVTDPVSLGDLPGGEYELSVSVVDPSGTVGAMRLAVDSVDPRAAVLGRISI